MMPEQHDQERHGVMLALGRKIRCTSCQGCLICLKQELWLDTSGWRPSCSECLESLA